MISVGITGGFASGKSETTRFFKKMGARVFDADLAAKKAIQKGQALYPAVLKLFGKSFLAPNGQIDRRKLGQHVFSKPQELKKLNTLIHPVVILEAIAFLEKHRNKKGLAVLDAPLLYEAKMERLVDTVVVVKSSQKNILARASKRGITPSFAKKILASQWPVEKKARRADHVIVNDGTVKSLEQKSKEVFKQIQSL